ncbi:hypothetical protein SNE40_022187 [Patella caerulea]|uniref:Uncharacterized protein n=1 Tax=Patella caerulea TaxID=87958 RepID=A0AAN8GF99_PATCE
MTEKLKSNQKRESVKKNRINDVFKWTMSPGGRSWYLDLLDSAIESVNVPPGFEQFKFSCRFGERGVNEIILSDYVDTSTVTRMSIHAAVLVDLSPLGMNAVWSRNGLYRLIGNRGQIWKSLTLSESCNFQSNRDGKRMAITPALYELAYHPQTLQFIQFYVDTPHMYPSGRCNPTSGSIVTAGLLHPKSVKHLHKSATEYISIMEENSTKITFPMCPRVETVCLTTDISDALNATDFINLDKLMALMNKESLLIPISEKGNGDFQLYFSQALKEVCLCLCGELKTLYEMNSGLGGYFPRWKSFK